MRKAGQIALFQFPQVDLHAGKSRPALLLAKLPGEYDDWLICMISSRLHQKVDGLDEVISPDAEDFIISGLKAESLIRVTRLAVVNEGILHGWIGEISSARLGRI